jgi:hypothetical protein
MYVFVLLPPGSLVVQNEFGFLSPGSSETLGFLYVTIRRVDKLMVDVLLWV